MLTKHCHLFWLQIEIPLKAQTVKSESTAAWSQWHRSCWNLFITWRLSDVLNLLKVQLISHYWAFTFTAIRIHICKHNMRNWRSSFLFRDKDSGMKRIPFTAAETFCLWSSNSRNIYLCQIWFADKELVATARVMVTQNIRGVVLTGRGESVFCSFGWQSASFACCITLRGWGALLWRSVVEVACQNWFIRCQLHAVPVSWIII